MDLSQRRAEFVRNHLINEGIDANRLEAVGMGESNPLISECDCQKNKCSEAELAINRRSEFIHIKD